MTRDGRPRRRTFRKHDDSSRCQAPSRRLSEAPDQPVGTGQTAGRTDGSSHKQARPPTRITGQTAHPAVPAARGPLAADPRQRRPLGQRQAVALGNHPAGHRPRMTGNRTAVRVQGAGRCCTQRCSGCGPDGLTRPTAGAALNGAVRPTLSLLGPVPPDCSSGSAGQLLRAGRWAIRGHLVAAGRRSQSAGPAGSAWAARSCWPSVSSSSTASGWARTSRFTSHAAAVGRRSPAKAAANARSPRHRAARCPAVSLRYELRRRQPVQLNR